MRNNTLKEKLLTGQTAIGPFMKLTDPATVEIAAHAGFDFVIIDMEHGPITFETAQHLIRAAELTGITPVVRVTENDSGLVLRALDIGAAAVEVPQVASADDARRAATAARFHPEGSRGMCRYVRAARYSALPREAYFSRANNEVLVVIHIEGLDGIERLDEILEVEGIDVVFIGPYDLSQACGVPGQVNHARVQAEMEKAVNRARACGKAVGTFVESVDDVRRWRSAGVQYLAYSVDVGILFGAYSDIVRRAEEALPAISELPRAIIAAENASS